MPIITPAQQFSKRFPIPITSRRNLITGSASLVNSTSSVPSSKYFNPVLAPHIKHWHSDEDEMVDSLEGEITVVEGAVETVLRPGDAAASKMRPPKEIFHGIHPAYHRCA